jgi:diketogulonate reductase-like aldo/keto reductase
MTGIWEARGPLRTRLGSEYLDLYLLHWPVPSAQFSGVVAAFVDRFRFSY